MNSNDFGKTIIHEECQKIYINDVLEQVKRNFKRYLIESQLEILGGNVQLTTSKTGFGGERIWFKCSLCNQRKGVLYIHPLSGEIGCRHCLHIGYKQRRYKGMIENSLN